MASPNKTMTRLTDLPVEILSQIMASLDLVEDLRNLSHSCARLYFVYKGNTRVLTPVLDLSVCSDFQPACFLMQEFERLRVGLEKKLEEEKKEEGDDDKEKVDEEEKGEKEKKEEKEEEEEAYDDDDDYEDCEDDYEDCEDEDEDEEEKGEGEDEEDEHPDSCACIRCQYGRKAIKLASEFDESPSDFFASKLDSLTLFQACKMSEHYGHVLEFSTYESGSHNHLHPGYTTLKVLESLTDLFSAAHNNGGSGSCLCCAMGGSHISMGFLKHKLFEQLHQMMAVHMMSMMPLLPGKKRYYEVEDIMREYFPKCEERYFSYF